MIFGEKKIKKKCCSTYKEREKAQEKARGTRLRAGRVSRSPAACSGNSLEHKGRMADGEQPAVLHPNASLLPYELFQPRCLHRLLEEQQKKKDFKAGLKDEWMRARIKGASKYEVQKKKKERKIRWVAKHKHSHRNAGQSREERLSRPSVPTYLFFHGRMTDATQRMGKHQTHAGEVKESEGTAKL